MPLTTPAANHQPDMGTPPVTRLVSVTGAVEPATPHDVEQRLAAGGFFWLDLESLDPGRRWSSSPAAARGRFGYRGDGGHRPVIRPCHGEYRRAAAAIPGCLG